MMIRRAARLARYAVMLFIAAPLYGQNVTGIFSGAVADTNGAAVPGVRVTITNARTGVTSYTGVSDDQGLYFAPALPAGVDDLTFEVPSFKKVAINNANLQVDQRARIDVVLEPGGVEESVVVTGDNLGTLERESSSIDEIINTSQVQNLPLPNRDVLNLRSLVGGVSSGGAATGINTSQLSINGGEAFNVLNRTNFNAPSTALNVTVNAAGNAFFNSPGFGLITSAKSARFIQLVARFEF